MTTLVFFVTLALLVAQDALAQLHQSERTVLEYDGVPIELQIPLKDEVRLRFDESVEVGMPDALLGLLDASSVHGIVYLNAHRAFATQRVAIRGETTGQFVLFDVSANEHGQIKGDVLVRLTQGEQPRVMVQPALTATFLLNHIAREVLAPRQASHPPEGLRRTTLNLEPNLLYRDFAVESAVLAAWQTRNWLALAVALRNQRSSPLSVDPLAINGSWQAAGFTHGRLLPRGKRGSESVMFLVGPRHALHRMGD